MYIFEQLTDR